MPNLVFVLQNAQFVRNLTLTCSASVHMCSGPAELLSPGLVLWLFRAVSSFWGGVV